MRIMSSVLAAAIAWSAVAAPAQADDMNTVDPSNTDTFGDWEAVGSTVSGDIRLSHTEDECSASGQTNMDPRWFHEADPDNPWKYFHLRAWMVNKVTGAMRTANICGQLSYTPGEALFDDRCRVQNAQGSITYDGGLGDTETRWVRNARSLVGRRPGLTVLSGEILAAPDEATAAETDAHHYFEFSFHARDTLTLWSLCLDRPDKMLLGNFSIHDVNPHDMPLMCEGDLADGCIS